MPPSSSPSLRRPASHSRTSAELKALVADNKIAVRLPGGLDKAHQDKLDKLKKLQGADFVREYKPWFPKAGHGARGR